MNGWILMVNVDKHASPDPMGTNNPNNATIEGQIPPNNAHTFAACLIPFDLPALALGILVAEKKGGLQNPLTTSHEDLLMLKANCPLTSWPLVGNEGMIPLLRASQLIIP